MQWVYVSIQPHDVALRKPWLMSILWGLAGLLLKTFAAQYFVHVGYLGTSCDIPEQGNTEIVVVTAISLMTVIA